MNAGAYGGEMKDVAVSADYVGWNGKCPIHRRFGNAAWLSA